MRATSVLLILASLAAPSIARSQVAGAPDDTLRIDLLEAYRIARAGSWSVRAAGAKVNRAEGNRLAAREALAPAVSPAFRFTTHRDRLQNTEGEFLDVDKQSARSGASLLLAWSPSEIIWKGAAASAEVEAVEASAAATERDAMWETARRYVSLASAEESLNIAARLLATLEQLESEVASRVSLGLSAEVDRLRVQNQAERQRAELVRARVAREGAMAQLAFALGLAAPRPIRTAGLTAVEVSEAELPAAIEEAQGRRSDLAAARESAAAARHERSSWTYGRLLPDLGAELSPGLLGPTFDEGESTYDANVVVSWRIGPGGLFDLGRLRMSSAAVDLAEIRVSELESQIASEVREVHAAARAAAELEAAAARSAEAAAKVFELTLERDERGISAPYELVQASDAWLRSSRELTQARAEAALARARLELVLERIGDANH